MRDRGRTQAPEETEKGGRKGIEVMRRRMSGIRQRGRTVEETANVRREREKKGRGVYECYEGMVKFIKQDERLERSNGKEQEVK